MHKSDPDGINEHVLPVPVVELAVEGLLRLTEVDASGGHRMVYSQRSASTG